MHIEILVAVRTKLIYVLFYINKMNTYGLSFKLKVKIKDLRSHLDHA